MKLHLIFIFVLSYFISFSQITNIFNERVYGGSLDDGAGKNVFFDDLGNTYILGSSLSGLTGDKSSPNYGDYDLWILKLDINYNLLWEISIGGTLFDGSSDALLFEDKLYFSSISFSDVSGNKTSANNGSTNTNDCWLICLDLDGNILWQENYGGSQGENNAAMAISPQNTIFMAMTSDSDVSGNKEVATSGVRDIWLLEIDPLDGAILRQKSLASDRLSAFNDVFVNSQNEVYLTFHAAPGVNGVKTDPGFGFNSCLLVLNSDWSIKNQKCFGGEFGSNDLEATIVEYDNFLYFSALHFGNPSTGNKTAPSYGLNDLWLIKMDTNLNFVWDKTFGGAGDEFGRLDFIKNDKINLNMSSTTTTNNNGNKLHLGFGSTDVLFMQLDLDGNILSQKTIGGTGSEFGAFHFKNNSSTKALFVAQSDSPISGLKSLPSKGGSDIWLFEVELSELLSVPEPVGFGVVEVYPNPTTDAVTFSLPENTKNIQLKLYTAEGKLVYEDVVLANEQSKTISLNAWNGVLFYTLESETTALSGKLVKM